MENVKIINEELEVLMQNTSENDAVLKNKIKDIFKFVKCDPVRHWKLLTDIMLEKRKLERFGNFYTFFVPMLIPLIQDVNKLDFKKDFKRYMEEQINDDAIFESITQPLRFREYRIETSESVLSKFKPPEFNTDIINECSRCVNYFKFMFTISKNIEPKHGYSLFTNILHNFDISYKYKLASLEYFAHCVNRIKSERAKYVAQMLPLILSTFYNAEGIPFLNDNVKDVDILVAISKFVNILCDESIIQQDDDPQQVALFSIISFILKIAYNHCNSISLCRNVEKIFNCLTYKDIDYKMSFNVYNTLEQVDISNEDEVTARVCLASLTWRLSTISPNFPKIFESVNILMPNIKTCVLENCTLELSMFAYMMFIQRINMNAFPLVFSHLYFLNILLRNSYNIMLCASMLPEQDRTKLIIKAYQMVIVSAVLVQEIKRTKREHFENIYKFKFRPYDFLKTMYETLVQHRHLKNYTKMVYYGISNLMRSFHWDLIYSMYSRNLIESTNDEVKGALANFLKDELFNRMNYVTALKSNKKCKGFQTEETLHDMLENGQNHIVQVDTKKKRPIEEKHTEIILTKEEEIHKLGRQIRKIVYALLSEESVRLNTNSLSVVLNIIKMILLNSRFKVFYPYLIVYDDNVTCFLQNKLNYFKEQIQIEKKVMLLDSSSNKSTEPLTNGNNKNNISEDIEALSDDEINSEPDILQLEIIQMLLEEVQELIQLIKKNNIK